MKFYSALAAVAALVATQDGSAQGPEGSQSQPQSPPQAADAGVVVVQPRAPDGGLTAEQVQQIQATHAELQAIRAELEAMRRSNDQLAAAADEAVQQLEATRVMQAQRLREIDTQRAAAVAIGALDQQLATGDTNIEGTLQQVDPSLSASARTYVQYARDALANSDITTARMYLRLAAQESQWSH
jgi:hypothetical protein